MPMDTVRSGFRTLTWHFLKLLNDNFSLFKKCVSIANILKYRLALKYRWLRYNACRWLRYNARLKLMPGEKYFKILFADQTDCIKFDLSKAQTTFLVMNRMCNLLIIL